MLGAALHLNTEVSGVETGYVLGAHLLGPLAEEVINLFAMAMRSRMTAADIKQMMFAYPTSASDIEYMV